MTGRNKIGGGLVVPQGTAAAELEQCRRELVGALAPHARDNAGKVIALKALAHALLYLAQRQDVPTSELVGFMRRAAGAYVSGALAMGDKARERLERGAGLPQWPAEPERLAINKVLEVVYRVGSRGRAAVAMGVCWDMLLRNAEPMGMTHEALIMRIETLDRFQRAEGTPERFIPAEPPSWVRL